MSAPLVDPFVSAAVDVLGNETGGPATAGASELQCDPYTTEEITAVIGMSGDVRGSMYLSMSTSTALATISAMLGQPVAEFDLLAQSGIAELANVIAGHAASALTSMGLPADIAPPLMLVGAGSRLSGVDIQRVAFPIQTPCGPMRIHVAVVSA
jgi:chemotaxis protein CheX